MESLEHACNRLRSEMERMKHEVCIVTLNQGEEKKEVLANLILSYRHLEDARMRLGKAIQADGDGVSVLDKMTDEERATFNARTVE